MYSGEKRFGALDLRQLRYFLAIVEEGSFSRAAARLHVAQPALSLHVRKMEEALETQLLLRGPQGVTPTEAGEVLAQRAMAMLSELGQTEEEIRTLGREPTGVVRLGLPGTIGGIVSVPLISRCHKRFPRIKIIVAEAMSGFVRQWLLDGRIDIAILYNDPQAGSFVHRPLLQEELVLLCPPGSDAGQSASLDSLPSRPLILPSGAHGLRTMLDRIFRERQLTVDPAFEVDSYVSIKRLVEDGLGYSILPFHAVKEEASGGRLVIQRFEDAEITRSVHLANAASRPMTRACSAVHELLGELVADLITSGKWAGARMLGEAAQREVPRPRS